LTQETLNSTPEAPVPITLREEIAQEINDVAARAISRITSEIERGVHDAKHAARESQASASRAAHEFVHEAKELAHDAHEGGRRLAKTAAHEVREHPIAAIAIGAAIGTLFGLLIAQRK
jgi:ElaB/YqjD/DUF883 family membrane-anchored ribosome-binding protein